MKLRNKIILKIFFIFLVVIILSKCSSKYFVINLTNSLPRGIYKLYPAINVKKGNIVVFDIPKNSKEYIYDRNYAPRIVSVLMKKVASDSLEDEIEVRNKELIINKHSWGKIHEKDSKKRELPRILIEDLKKVDHFILLSEADNSYDSRYFGAVPRKAIRHRAKLILKF